MGAHNSVAKIMQAESTNGTNTQNPDQSRTTIKDVIKNMPKDPVNNALYGLLMEKNKHLLQQATMASDNKTSETPGDGDVKTTSKMEHVEDKETKDKAPNTDTNMIASAAKYEPPTPPRPVNSAVAFAPKKRFRQRFDLGEETTNQATVTNDSSKQLSHPSNNVVNDKLDNNSKPSPPTTLSDNQQTGDVDAKIVHSKSDNGSIDVKNGELTLTSLQATFTPSADTQGRSRSVDLQHSSRLSPSSGKYNGERTHLKDGSTVVSMRTYMDEMMARMVRAPLLELEAKSKIVPMDETHASETTPVNSNQAEKPLSSQEKRILTQSDLIQQKIREMLKDDVNSAANNGKDKDQDHQDQSEASLSGITPLTLISAQIEAVMRQQPYNLSSLMQQKKQSPPTPQPPPPGVASGNESSPQPPSTTSSPSMSYPQLRLQLQGGPNKPLGGRVQTGSISKGTPSVLKSRPKFDPALVEARKAHPDTVYSLVTSDIKQRVFSQKDDDPKISGRSSHPASKHRDSTLSPDELRVRSNSWSFQKQHPSKSLLDHYNSQLRSKPRLRESQETSLLQHTLMSPERPASYHGHQPEGPERPASYHGHQADGMVPRRPSFSQSLRDAYFEKQQHLSKFMKDRLTPSDERNLQQASRYDNRGIPQPRPSSKAQVPSPSPHHLKSHPPHYTRPKEIEMMAGRYREGAYSEGRTISREHNDSRSAYDHRNRREEDYKPDHVMFQPTPAEPLRTPHSFGSITRGTPRSVPVVSDQQRESILNEAYQIQSSMTRGHQGYEKMPDPGKKPPLLPLMQREDHVRMKSGNPVHLTLPERERSRSRSPISRDGYNYVQQPYASARPRGNSGDCPLDLSKKDQKGAPSPPLVSSRHTKYHPYDDRQAAQIREKPPTDKHPSHPDRPTHHLGPYPHGGVGEKHHFNHYPGGKHSPAPHHPGPYPPSVGDKHHPSQYHGEKHSSYPGGEVKARHYAEGDKGTHPPSLPPPLEKIYQEDWLKHYTLPAHGRHHYVEKQLHKESHPDWPNRQYQNPDGKEGHEWANRASKHYERPSEAPESHPPTDQYQKTADQFQGHPPTTADQYQAAAHAQLMATYGAAPFGLIYPVPLAMNHPALYAVHGSELYKQNPNQLSSALALPSRVPTSAPMQISPNHKHDEAQQHSRPNSPAKSQKQDRSRQAIGLNLLGDHPPDDVLSMKCNLCFSDYGNLNSFVRHFQRDHSKEGGPQRHHVTIKSITKAKSEKVASSSTSMNTLYGGMYKHEYENSESDNDRNGRPHEENLSSLDTGAKEVNSRDSVMKCFHCDQEFPTRDWGMFRRHMKSHESPLENIRCSDCHVAFRDRHEWQLHMSLYHKNHTCVCKVCNVGFAHIDAMYKHVHTAHSGLGNVEVEFCCLQCNKSFNNERDLSEHRQIHDFQGRGSPGAHVSMSVRARVRDQQTSPPSPNIVHRVTPDTTCKEDVRLPCSEPETVISRSDSISQDTVTSYKVNPVTKATSQSPDIPLAAFFPKVTFFEMLQQKVEDEHRRQGKTLARSKESSPKTDILDSNKLFDANNSGLKRRIYDNILQEQSPNKVPKLDSGDEHKQMDSKTWTADSVISGIVESALAESHSSNKEETAEEKRPQNMQALMTSLFSSMPIVSTPEDIKQIMEAMAQKQETGASNHSKQAGYKTPTAGYGKPQFTDSDLIAATVLAEISGSGVGGPEKKQNMGDSKTVSDVISNHYNPQESVQRFSPLSVKSVKQADDVDNRTSSSGDRVHTNSRASPLQQRDDYTEHSSSSDKETSQDEQSQEVEKSADNISDNLGESNIESEKRATSDFSENSRDVSSDNRTSSEGSVAVHSKPAAVVDRLDSFEDSPLVIAWDENEQNNDDNSQTESE